MRIFSAGIIALSSAMLPRSQGSSEGLGSSSASLLRPGAAVPQINSEAHENYQPPGFDLTSSTSCMHSRGDGPIGPEAVGAEPLVARSTGTTIVGVLCPKAGAVILAADTRATNGELVADKRCEKIHRLAPNIYCCGAGTAADAEHLTRLVIQ